MLLIHDQNDQRELVFLLFQVQHFAQLHDVALCRCYLLHTAFHYVASLELWAFHHVAVYRCFVVASGRCADVSSNK